MKSTLSLFDKIILSPLWILTLFSIPVLYLFSDFLYLILYYLVGYRKKVVSKNITRSFPEKKPEEILNIAKKFYRYLCDYFVESLYLLNMSAVECNRRYRFMNIELLNELAQKKRNIILATCHYGNWEWANNLNNISPYKILGIYKPLSNKLFNRLLIHIRGKYGSIPIPMKHTLREAIDSITKNELFALYSVADQRPGGDDLRYWTTFFNQEAPIITGIEKISRKFNLAVVFLMVRRVKRGYYQITLELLVEDPARHAEYEIIEKYIRKVEELVKERPEFYLWSHKRWKYKHENYKRADRS